jgi:hypothetical protein
MFALATTQSTKSKLGPIDLTKVPGLGPMIPLHVTPPSKRRSSCAFVLVFHSLAAFEVSAARLSTCILEHTTEGLQQDHIVTVRTDVRKVKSIREPKGMPWA